MRIEHFDWLPTGGVGAIVNNVRWSTYALALLKQQYFFCLYGRFGESKF